MVFVIFDRNEIDRVSGIVTTLSCPNPGKDFKTSTLNNTQLQKDKIWLFTAFLMNYFIKIVENK